jgi:anti-sigma B factor antagonist
MLSGGKLTTRGTQTSVRHVRLDPGWRPGSLNRPDLQVVALYQPDSVVLAVSGELDVASAPMLRAQIKFALGGRPARLVLDLAGLRFCDAAGLSALVMARKAATRDGASLALAAVPRPVTRLLKITGMNRMLDLYPSVAAATMQLPDAATQ